MKYIFQLPDETDKEISYFLGLVLKIKSRFLSLDLLQVIAAVFLIIFGLTFIYSAGQHVGGIMTTAWEKQIMWVLAGVAVWVILSYTNYNIFAVIAPIFYLITIILLIMIFFMGVKIYGARRWLDFGICRIQPSEFAKVSCLLLISYIASRKNFMINRLSHLFGLFIFAAIPFVLVQKEPDMGSAHIFIVIFATVVFCAKVSWKWILVVIVACAIIIPSTYPFLHDYQKERILVFFDPKRDPLSQGWTSRQTLLSVGSGGFAGKGLLQGTQNTLGFLPQSVSNSDLIFSVIAEESGFIGSLFMIIMYGLLVLSMIRTAFLAKDKFGYLFASGVAMLFFEHLYVNIGMNIRLMPITGIPLPLISYGGSFMLSSMICLGILQSIYMRRNSVV